MEDGGQEGQQSMQEDRASAAQEVPLDKLVRAIGKLHNQSDEAIENALSVFQSNWVSSLSEWKNLSPEDRQAVPPPSSLPSIFSLPFTSLSLRCCVVLTKRGTAARHRVGVNVVCKKVVGVPVMLEQQLHMLLELEAGENGPELFARETARLLCLLDERNDHRQEEQTGKSQEDEEEEDDDDEGEEDEDEGQDRDGRGAVGSQFHAADPSTTLLEMFVGGQQQEGKRTTSIQSFLKEHHHYAPYSFPLSHSSSSSSSLSSSSGSSPSPISSIVFYVWMTEDFFQLETHSSVACELSGRNPSVGDMLSSSFPEIPNAALFDLDFHLVCLLSFFPSFDLFVSVCSPLTKDTTDLEILLPEACYEEPKADLKGRF